MNLNRAMRCPYVISDIVAVNHELAKMGMTRHWILEAVRQGNISHAFAPPNGFDGAPEYFGANMAMSKLCEDSPDGAFRRDSYRRIPVVMHRNERLAFNVTTGDENTGLLTDFDPESTTRKGSDHREAARASRPQQGVLDLTPVDFWNLLVYWGDDARCEISQPIDVDSAGHLAGWTKRILVGHADPTGGPSRIDVPDTPQPVPTIHRRSRAS